MKLFSALILSIFVTSVDAQDFNRYNQQYTMNQNYGVSNWMTAFGPGINTAAVTLVGGIVNMMSRPDPVVVQQQAPIYVNGGGSGGGYPQQGGYGYQGSGRCSIQTVFDQNGNARSVNICP